LSLERLSIDFSVKSVRLSIRPMRLSLRLHLELSEIPY